MALAEAKKGSDIHHYNEAIELAKRNLSAKEIEGLHDPAWVAQQEKKNIVETDRMERELKGYKNNLIKESIRVRSDRTLYTYMLTLSDGQRRPRHTLLQHW